MCTDQRSNRKAQITLVFAAFKTCREKRLCYHYNHQQLQSIYCKVLYILMAKWATINGQYSVLKRVVLKVVYYNLYEILITELKLVDRLGIMLLHFLCVRLFGVL